LKPFNLLKGNLMKIALIGASGNVGSRILEEALRRGHNLVAIARDAGKIGAPA
jgi:putative NADH-flavin reductase